MSKGFVEDDITREVRMRTDIVALISEYVRLRKTGEELCGSMPVSRRENGLVYGRPGQAAFYCFDAVRAGTHLRSS